MRKRFEIQYELGATPIEEIKIPLDSRDELPPTLRALQHIYATPKLNNQVFDILERNVLPGVDFTTGCPCLRQTGRHEFLGNISFRDSKAR